MKLLQATRFLLKRFGNPNIAAKTSRCLSTTNSNKQKVCVRLFNDFPRVLLLIFLLFIFPVDR